MSWHYLQGQEEASWGGSCSDGAPSALLSLIPTAGPCCSQGSGTECLEGSRYGMTSALSTASHGVGTSTLSAAGFLARTSPSLASRLASRVRDQAYGKKWRESSARFDLATSSWKTARTLFVEDLPWSSVALQRWGTMHAGVCSEPSTPVRLIRESGSGSWQTPVADDAVARTNGKWNSRGEPELSAQVLFPTPSAVSYGTNQGGAAGRTGPVRPSLQTMAAKNLWPTPQARDYKGAPGKGCRSRGGHQSSLPADVGGSLNPPWVEWLMGWPIGWTDLESLATAKFRQWSDSHGICGRQPLF